ncbi:hypothetical protein GCM10028857_09370 [Salinarchaeum chitinilyticum]
MASTSSGSPAQGSNVNDYARLGIALYLALAVGNFVYKLLEYMFVDSNS